MAVDATAFYVDQTELDARIDTLVSDIQTNIDAIVTHLTEDVTTGYVSVNDGEHSQFNKKTKVIEKQFKWYKDLANIGDTFRLMGAYADDYSYSAKECFVLDRVSLTN
jgi:hypothetical protein